jgi:putative ABC transport system permease protein
MSLTAHDVRQALRTFRRAPLFYAGLVLTLGLGIGANASVFSILQAVLLQPLPYDHPKNVVMVWRSRQYVPVGQTNEMLQGPAWRRGFLTADNVVAWRGASKGALADLAAIKSWTGNTDAQFDLLLSDHAERLRGAFASPNLFEVLGVQAARGRVFVSADETATESLAVISDGLWRRAFGADPGIVGRSVTLIAGARPRAPRAFRIIGVLPAPFRFTYPEETEVWVAWPFAEIAREPRGAICCTTVARLAPGMTLETASARVATVREGLRDDPRSPEDREVIRLERAYDWVVGETGPSLWLLASVALLLLTITCATVANALLVRISERRQELAVRASLGADRWRLVRQLLTEGAMLAAGGALVGLSLAAFTAPLLRSILPSEIPRADAVGVNGWMLLFAIAAAAVTTITAATLPAWRGARVDLVPALKSGSGGSSDVSTARTREALVAAQVAVATLLLISATLLLASFWRLSRVPLGFDGTRVLTVEMRLMDQKYLGKWLPSGRFLQSPGLDVFRHDLIERVTALPGVVEAGLTSAVPFRGVDFTYVLSAVGQRKTVVGNARFVDAGYFTVMRIPLMRGRLVSDTDTVVSQKVVVLSESYARLMFGSDDPLGKRIDPDDPAEVVGIVGDVRYVARDRNPQPALYFPAAQGPSSVVCLVARTAPNGDVATAVRHVIHDLDPALPAMKMTTMERIVDESVASRRFYTTATAAFAAIALVLTVVGLVVIVARSVVERRRELAIRSALGATRRRILELVVRQGVSPVLVGAAIGLAGAYTGSTLIARFLFDVSPRQPLIYLAAALLVIGIVGLAALVPARRASAIDPALVLKAQ